MEKIDLGNIKEVTRVKMGITQKLKLFNKKQKGMIIQAVENRPDDMNLGDVLNLYEVTPSVYHSWIKKRKKDKLYNLENNVGTSIIEKSMFSISENGKNKWKIEIVADNEERASYYLKMIQECFEISAKHNLPMTSTYMCDPERNEKLTCIKS
jgi:hypothetical protein